MKIPIRLAPQFGMKCFLCHDFERKLHLIQMLSAGPFSGQGSGFRFHHLTKLEKISEQLTRWFFGNHPAKYVRVQQMPLRCVSNTRPEFWPELDQTFCHQNLYSLVVGCARGFEHLASLDFAVQGVPGRRRPETILLTILAAILPSKQILRTLAVLFSWHDALRGIPLIPRDMGQPKYHMITGGVQSSATSHREKLQ
jgi:hypothetical protein